MSIKSQVWKTKPHTSYLITIVILLADAFHDKSGIKKWVIYKVIIQGVVGRSYLYSHLSTFE